MLHVKFFSCLSQNTQNKILGIFRIKGALFVIFPPQLNIVSKKLNKSYKSQKWNKLIKFSYKSYVIPYVVSPVFQLTKNLHGTDLWI